jgi:hypothetical protein
MVICVVFTQTQSTLRSRRSLFCSHPQKRHVVSPLPATLADSASCKSFPCRSYENSRSGMPPHTHFPAPYSLSTTHHSLSPLESTLPKNGRVTRLESADPKTLDLKSFRIRTYEKGRGEGGKRLTRNPRRSTLDGRSMLKARLLPDPFLLRATVPPWPICVSLSSLSNHEPRATGHKPRTRVPEK